MTTEFAIIFDMDGVLIDSNPYHKIALRQFCSQHGYDLTESQLREKIYGRTNKEWLTNLFGSLSEEKVNQLAEEKEQLFRKLFAKDIKPVAGLISFLNDLDKHGIARAIATSAPRSNVDFTFQKTGIGKYFATVLNDTHIAHSKPHPEIYLKTAATLGFPPSQCVVFEDSISGIEAGLAAGAKVVGVSTTHTAAEMNGISFSIPDFVDLNLANLAALFEA